MTLTGTDASVEDCDVKRVECQYLYSSCGTLSSQAPVRGTGLPNPSRETKFSGANADRIIFLYIHTWEMDHGSTAK